MCKVENQYIYKFVACSVSFQILFEQIYNMKMNIGAFDVQEIKSRNILFMF